ncbi:MAG: acetate kinase [Victivallaceae bacterium]|nr:acetate kinase [Victivallaceae bacterium]
MRVLVLNAGSSSVKFTLYSMAHETVLAKGQVERLGLENPNLIYKRIADGYKSEQERRDIKNIEDAIRAICEKLTDKKVGVISSLSEIEAIGHRVLHGGERATRPVMVNSEVKDIIRDCIPLGPLHNPANLAGIEACERIFPNVPNVAAFDTEFHQTMPPQAFLYAIPYEFYTKYGIRRYGFHGTSHNFVSRAAAAYMDRPLATLKLITCHLGNGCSITAINNGVVVDTSMGLTPLEGLMMGTRSGDIDPAVVLRLMELGKTREEIDKLLNKQSGLLGVGGIGSSDMRDIIAAEMKGDQQALLARRMFTRRVVKYIGAYFTLLNGADAIVFTGGVGEWSNYVRAKVIAKLSCLGVKLDEAANEKCLGRPGTISTADSRIKVIVMPTDEELMIARSVLETLKMEDVRLNPNKKAVK